MLFCIQTKLAILEQKLLKEEHERKLVQEKANKVSPHTQLFRSSKNKKTQSTFTLNLFNLP